MAFVKRLAWVALLAGICIGATGCSASLNNMVIKRTPPVVELRDSRVQKVDWASTTFGVSAEFTNRDPNAITVDTADYALTVADVRIATGSTRIKTTVNPGETITITLPIEVNYYRLLEVVRKHPELITQTGQIGGELSGVARGTSSFATVTSTIEGTVAIPLTNDAWSGEGFPAPRSR